MLGPVVRSRRTLVQPTREEKELVVLRHLLVKNVPYDTMRDFAPLALMIEAQIVIAAHPSVLECAVVGLPDPRWGEQVVAVVVLRPGHWASDEQLLESVQSVLARYKHPRRWVRLQALPKTALGKVQKAVLKTQLSAP